MQTPQEKSKLRMDSNSPRPDKRGERIKKKEKKMITIKEAVFEHEGSELINVYKCSNCGSVSTEKKQIINCYHCGHHHDYHISTMEVK